MLVDASQAVLLKHAFKRPARGVRRVPGQMNKLETRYYHHLTGRQTLGQIEWFAFEAVTFKLAFDTRYTPDFMVLRKDTVIEFHEVKGFWEEDAKIKIKCAAEKFPFIFIGIKSVKGVWEFENYSRSLAEPGLVHLEVGA